MVLDALTYADNHSDLLTPDRKDGLTFVHGDICERDFVANVIANDQLMAPQRPPRRSIRRDFGCSGARA